MSERIEIVKSFYGNIDEDTRLNRSRHGQMEYLTTMEYIHRYVTDSAKILEIGAGTGRYSIALAKEGYDVTAIELVEHNLDILKANSGDLGNLKSFQGDALDLSRFKDGEFDITLVLGPMYHLYANDDVKKAMEPLFTTGGEERAGLGFAVMQTFMDSLKVKSSVGKGTRVVMTKKIKPRDQNVITA